MATQKSRWRNVVTIVAVLALAAISLYYFVGSGGCAPSISGLNEKGDILGLVEVLQGDDPTRAADAAAALAELADPASVDSLISIVEADPFSSAASDAVGILAKIGDVRAVPAIVSVLEATPSASARSVVERYNQPDAVKALGQLGDGSAAEPIVTWVKERGVLTEEDKAIVNEALKALGEGAVEPLVEAARDDDARRDARMWAVTMLGEIGDPAAAPALVALLADSMLDRQQIVVSLAKMGVGAVDPLLAGLESEDWVVVTYSAKALGQIGDKRGEEDLLALMQTGVEGAGAVNAQRAASDALALINKDDPAKLLAWLEAKKTRFIYYGLIHLGLPETEAPLLEAFDRYANQSMAEQFLNSGNAALKEAATEWAEANGYDIMTFSNVSSGTSETGWGSLGGE